MLMEIQTNTHLVIERMDVSQKNDKEVPYDPGVSQLSLYTKETQFSHKIPPLP
jgi:hypothetical protein